MYPMIRGRRLRINPKIRELVEETRLSIKDMVYPIFVDANISKKKKIKSMPGIYRNSLKCLEKEIKEVDDLGIPAVILFGIPKKKDEIGSRAYYKKGIIQKALRIIKKKSEICVITDLCLCEYTSHGHCGIVENENIQNDETLEIYKKIAVSQAIAGSDMIAPSGMMDGMVSAIRNALDTNGFSELPILSYSSKYASSFYSPFRDASECAPSFGDRKNHQMNIPNSNEAVLETLLDIEEGADIVMVKPAMPYLDIIYKLKENVKKPIAAYQVSGEYSLIKAAAKNNWIDEEKVMLESLISIKRAGADIIITYFAKEYARLIK